MLLSHSQPRKRHSSKTQLHNDTLPEMHPAVPGYKATMINFPAHSGEIQTLSCLWKCDAVVSPENSTGPFLLLLHCHLSQKNERFKPSVKAANIYIPHQNELLDNESRTALSCCLHCSFSSCHWHTQQCWFCQQLQKCWQSVTINCKQGTSRGHKTLWLNGCLCWGCF